MSLRLRSVGLVALVCLLLSACAPTARPVPHVTLTFASWAFIGPEQQAFIDEVTSKSKGTITVKAIENWTTPGGVERIDDEMSMAKALASDSIDLGFTSTRSFPTLGITGFRAIEVPFLIQNYAGSKDIATGPIGTRGLKALSSAGLTGLAAYSGALRYPLTAHAPLQQPSDWAGKRVVYYGTPGEDSVQTRTIAALGGVPTFEGLHIIDDLNAGTVDGGLDSLGDVAQGGATAQGPYVTSNLVFWPTILFLVANSKKFASLGPSQRALIARAAQRAAMTATGDGSPDLEAGTAVCDSGARFGTSTPEQLTEMRAAVQPVYDWLENDPVEAPLLGELEAIAAAHPQAEAISVRAGCAWDAAG